MPNTVYTYKIHIICKHFADNIFKQSLGKCAHGVMVKALDCGIVVSEFELQLR